MRWARWVDAVREVFRSVIVTHTPAEMFALVADVARYPEFVPWCADAEVLSRDDAELTGRIDMAMGPLTGGLTTRNRLDPPRSMKLELVKGPFSALQGEWQFTPRGEAGCKVALRIRFAFASPLKDFVLGPVFEQSCSRLVQAFVARAAEIYG
jgi:ribosome-associated toxin RatA of RatAB toxin-antitoxin module